MCEVQALGRTLADAGGQFGAVSGVQGRKGAQDMSRWGPLGHGKGCGAVGSYWRRVLSGS